jgi:Tol biopolymer transport system component
VKVALSLAAVLAALIVVTASVGARGTAAAGQSPVALSGNWKILIEMPDAPTPPVCTLASARDTLTGTCGVPGFSTPVLDGTTRGARVQFSLLVGRDRYVFDGARQQNGSVRGTLVIQASTGNRTAPFSMQPTSETQTVNFAIVDRQGTRSPLGPPPPAIFAPRLSPDGRRIAFDQFDGSVWVAPVASVTTATRLPVSMARFPLWGGDGEQLLFVAPVDAEQSLFITRVDGTVAPRMLVRPARAPESWSAARNGVSFIRLSGDDYDIWFYSATDGAVTPLVVIPGSRQLSSQISPDGRWLAYMSDEAGGFDIYVQPFPTGPRTRVTRTGGRDPHWSTDGRELFYDDGVRIFARSVSSGQELRFGEPQAVPVEGLIQGNSLRRLWDIGPDGRFLAMVR